MPGRSQPLLAGVVTALVGFASSFTVVLAGLRAAGASDAQAASGLLALCVACGLAAAWLGWRHRVPFKWLLQRGSCGVLRLDSAS
ncbi:benzoate/H(+) symporter BenE family transporter [Micromonospora sp. GCM10011542]|uniref:benzoate/H(+) symporter BenE family transporter n=1 Tax=Micromonospora sp. GCM10011542 TaxID=3317337 RepID=UPI00360ECF9D